MRTFVLTLLMGVASLVGHAQKKTVASSSAAGRPLSAFIPLHYDTLADSRATGDLNHDGRPDMALVLRPDAETTADQPDDKLPPRVLLVLFGTPTGYVLAGQARRAVLCKGCGGMNGDPFASLSIAKGVLTLEHYGGSDWRWSITSRFRYQAGGFYLIGQTNDYGRAGGDCAGLDGPAGRKYRDTNFVTGDYEVEEISEVCKLLVHRRGKNKPAPLRKLADYVVVP